MGPCAPVAPTDPCAPVAPLTPVGPIGPCGPVAPAEPCAPAAPACAIIAHGSVPGTVPAATGPVATYVDVLPRVAAPPVATTCDPPALEYVHWLSPLMPHVP